MITTVHLGERSYPIRITDSYQALPAWLRSLNLPSQQGWIISHQSLLRRYGLQLITPLRRAGWNVNTITVPESETSKSWAAVQRIMAPLASATPMRAPTLIAFGGGVIGDLTGFVAAMFRRGVPYVQVPTTLLAQVDSAIGGKVGIDLPQGKNLVGAFYQPRLVCNNVMVLQTLPLRERRSGLAEVIKYGAIADPKLFEFLETHLETCLSLETRAVRVMVERSCAIKTRVVSRDEREKTGLRAHLNFGHTLGHALEAAGHYTRWTHGEAIAIGMCAAGHLSMQMGFLSKQSFQRLVDLIRRAGLPTSAHGVSHALVLRALRYDKKFIHGRPRWVLLKRIGHAVVTEAVPESLMGRVLKRYTC